MTHLRVLLFLFAMSICQGKAWGQLVADSLLLPQKVDSTYIQKLLQFSKEKTYLEPERALEVNRKLIQIGDSLGDPELKAKGHLGMGLANTVLSNSHDAISWLDSASQSSLLIPDSQLYYRATMLKGVNFDGIGHFRRSLEAFREALTYYQREDDTLQVAMISNNIGGIYFQQQDNNLAIDHFAQGQKAGKAVGHTRLYTVATINLGHVYLNMDSLERSEEYFVEAYRFIHEEGNFEGHGTLCAKFGELRVKQGRLEEAREILDEGLQAAREQEDDLSLSKVMIAIAELEGKKGDLEKAMTAYDSARAISIELQSPDQEIEALKGIYQLYESMGELDKAYLAYKEYNQLHDSLFGDEKARQLEELSAIHNFERRQLEIQELKSEKEFQSRLLNQQNWFIGGLALVLLLALILLFLVYRSERRRSAINRSLEERNRKIAEQQEEILSQNDTLASQNMHLERLNSEMEGLIEIVAHDLKSPITKTQALMSMVEEEGLPETAAPKVAMINRVLEGGMDLIKSILTVGRIENKSQIVSLAELDLVEFLNGVADTFEGKAKEKRIGLNREFPDGPVRVRSSADSLSRIMENLVSNALKFSKGGTDVTLALRTREKAVEIVVKDQGPGISEADQKVMFRKFQRLSAKPTGGESSTGLGLSIVDTLVKQLGGEIRVESKLGNGASFIVSLPLSGQ